MTELLDLLAPGESTPWRQFGVVTGVVTNNVDPEKIGRVKVRFPWLSDEDESEWARLAVPMAGPKAGTFFLPEVDDEVLVAFEQGDMRFPYVLGCLWHGGDPPAEPPQDDDAGKQRVIRSRSGLSIKLDDTDGAELIEIADSSGTSKIVIDAAAGTILVEGDKGVTVRAANGPLELEGQSVTIKAQAKVDVQGAQINLG
jgi:uncharacterized protein involved in type VI secretion and phage assembly